MGWFWKHAAMLAGGGAAPEPPLSLGAYYWFDPRLSTLAATGTFTDRIRGLTCSQAVGTKQPTYSSSIATLNNLPGFNYASASLQTMDSGAGAVPTAIASGDYTQYVQLYQATAAIMIQMCIRDSPGTEWEYLAQFAAGQTRSEQTRSGGNTISTSAANLLATYGWTASGKSGANHYSWNSAGGKGTVAVPAGTLTASRLWLGSLADTFHFNGAIGHIVIFDRALSAAEETEMESWLNSL